MRSKGGAEVDRSLLSECRLLQSTMEGKIKIDSGAIPPTPACVQLQRLFQVNAGIHKLPEMDGWMVQNFLGAWLRPTPTTGGGVFLTFPLPLYLLREINTNNALFYVRRKHYCRRGSRGAAGKKPHDT